MTSETKRKGIKTAASALWWVLLIILAVLLVTVLSAKMRGEVPNIFGYSVLRIVSGSMEPEISVGEYILIRASASEDIKEGDIISFYSRDPQIAGMPNTHRVAAAPIITDSGIEFITRGDANLKNDDYRVSEDELIGKYVMSLSALGAFSDFLGGGAMLALLIILQLASVGFFIYSFVKRGYGEDGSRTDDDKVEKLKAEAIREYLASQTEDKDPPENGGGE